MVHFDSVALTLAILAILVFLEQLAKDTFSSQILKLRKILAYHITVDLGKNSLRHLENLSDVQLLLVIENGLTSMEFIRNEARSACWSSLRERPSSVLMRNQAWCIRRNFGIGAVITVICAYCFGYLLLTYLKIFKLAGCYNCKEEGWWFWNSGTPHITRYSGKQYDRCMRNLLLHIGWVTSTNILGCIEWIAWLGSYSESDYTGPFTASQIACCRQITLGAVLSDIAILHHTNDMGKHIRFHTHLHNVQISNGSQRYEVKMPNLIVEPGISRIFQYYRNNRTKDQLFFDAQIARIFEFFEYPAMITSIGCNDHEGDCSERCTWRGRPVLIMTSQEMATLALKGSLYKRKCIVVYHTDNIHETASIASVSVIFKQNIDIDTCVTMLMNISFVICIGYSINHD